MCDTLVVIWPDKIGFAKNSDRDPNEAQRLEWLPSAEHSPESQLRCTWKTIPQVRRTLPVLLSRPFWTWGAEMGTNANGLVIGNEAVFTKADFDEPGLTGMDLVRLALERAECVEQAVEVISDLLKQHGQGGRSGYSNPAFRYHNSFLIADRKGAAVLETAGREVAVQRVEIGVRAISNGLTLPELSHQADRVRGAVAACKIRRARMEALGAASLSGETTQAATSLHSSSSHSSSSHSAALQPFATQAKGLAAALRDHGQAGQQPQFRRINGALSAPCVHWGGMLAGSQTVASWVSILGPAGVQHWVTGTSAPCLSLFRPVSLNRPRDTGLPEGHPDAASLWWRFERIHREAMKDWSAASSMRKERDELEKRVFEFPQDEDSHWETADRWLESWTERMPKLTDCRPAWLRRRWSIVQAEAAGGNRLPPWN